MMTESEFKKLSPSQRKSIQERLKAQGLYAGEVDGSYGSGTEAALKEEERRRVEGESQARQSAEKARADKLREEELALERERLKQSGGAQDVANKEAEAKLARKAEYDRQAGSPEGMAAQSFASVGMPALAGAAGLKFGDKVNQRMDRQQAARNETLRGAADDRVRGLTTRDGAVKGARLAGALPSENPLLRVGGRMAPHAGLAALSGLKGYQLLSDVDEDQAFYPRMADRGAGLGYLGFGGGIMKRGIEQAAGGGLSPDAQALSVINSSQLRRNGPGGRNALLDVAQDRGAIVDAEVVPEGQRALPAPESAPKAPTPGTRAAMLAQAKDLQIKGATRMNKADLASAVSNALQEHGGKRTVGKRGPKTAGALGPIAAAGLAYLATPDDANASTDGGSVTGRDTALTNAAVTGGIASATGAALRGMGGVLEPVGAMTIDPLEGASREESMDNIRRARGQASYYAPGTAEFFGIPRSEGTAYDVTENPGNLPERSPRREASVAKEATDRGEVPDRNENRGPAAKLSHPGESSPAPQPRVTREPTQNTNSAPPEAEDFEAQINELERIFAQMQGGPAPQQKPVQAAQSTPQMPPAPPSFSMPQNRLLQAAY